MMKIAAVCGGVRYRRWRNAGKKVALSFRVRKNHPLVLFKLVGAGFKFDEGESDQNKST
jgi:hypothetical protein